MEKTPAKPGKQQRAMDFDRLSRLAKRRPKAFEALREKLIREAIASVPDGGQGLARLQFRIDGVRKRSPTPYLACLRISELMWQRFLALNDYVSRVGQAAEAAPAPLRQAQIVDLAAVRRRRQTAT